MSPTDSVGEVQIHHELVQRAAHAFKNELVQFMIRDSNILTSVHGSKNERVLEFEPVAFSTPASCSGDAFGGATLAPDVSRVGVLPLHMPVAAVFSVEFRPEIWHRVKPR